ncbi:hypothetical protein CEXT_188241 [Caerostris extrusa]|uniref:GPR180/TMEM145 transmembrane domain-containing protein n=1 Tax=Caerostris extrusa TaxID=172846 RepID=A0AAV4TYB7_CAEEX|nr:hypothetical protein CEXT_188241 [Caerostris extrusa]
MSQTVMKRYCAEMFQKIDTVAYDKNCKENGTEDFENVPCPVGELCEDEDAPERVVNEHQFTYAVLDNTQAKMKIFNAFTGTVEMYLVLLGLYFILILLQIYAGVYHYNNVTKLYAASLQLQLQYVLFSVVYVVKIASDGESIELLRIIGDVMYLFAQSLFMLLLLLLAKGWAITRTELTWKPVLLSIWLLYTLVGVLLYVWNMAEVDVIDDIDEYQTFPGWIILIFRLAIMVVLV